MYCYGQLQFRRNSKQRIKLMDFSRYTKFIHEPSGRFSVFDKIKKRHLTSYEIQKLELQFQKQIKLTPKQTPEEILEIFKQEANKEKDKSSDFLHGKSCGKMEAYSHAYFLLRKFIETF